MISRLENEISKKPEGVLIAQSTHGKGIFYIRNGKTRKYISDKEIKKITAMAQKEYMEKLLRDFKIVKEVLSSSFRSLEKLLPEKDALTSLHPLKRELITPLKLFSSNNPRWDRTNAKTVDKKTHPYETRKGDFVRSKIEMIIADFLFNLGVPYVYEMSIVIDGVVYKPDFFILNLVTGEFIIWEHFGLMNDPSYIANNAGKLMAYISAGYKFGRNLIFTMEGREDPIKTDIILRLIKDYCLNAPF